MSCTLSSSMRSHHLGKVGRGELFEEEAPRCPQRPSLASSAPAGSLAAALAGDSETSKLKKPSVTRSLAYTLPCMRAQVRKAELQQSEEAQQQLQLRGKGKGRGQQRAMSPTSTATSTSIATSSSTPISPRSPGVSSLASQEEQSRSDRSFSSVFQAHLSSFQPPSRIPAPKPKVKSATATSTSTSASSRVAASASLEVSSIPTPVRSLAAARAAYKRSVGAVGRTNSFNRNIRGKLDDMVDTFSSCASTTCTQLTPRDRSP